MEKKLLIKNIGDVTVVGGTAGAGKNAYMYGMANMIGMEQCGIILTETPLRHLLDKDVQFSAVCTVPIGSPESSIYTLLNAAEKMQREHVFIENLVLHHYTDRNVFVREATVLAKRLGIHIWIGTALNRDSSMQDLT